MKILLFISVIFICASCETFDAADALFSGRDTIVDDSAKYYVDMYFNEARARSVDPNPYMKTFSVKFEFNPRSKNGYIVDGKAISNKLNTHTDIIIDIEHWNDSPEQRDVLMFHELGHGLLNYNHDANRIMKPALDKYDLYKTNRTEMLNEFFNSSL